MTRSYQELFRVFGRIGLQSFGGPAAQIALMHKELVEDRNWLTEEQYLRALSFCMLLPGPEAMQLATYTGWRQRGIVGGLIAGGLFVIPGAFVIMALSLAYGTYGNLGWVQAAFVGIQAAVVVIVISALQKVAKKALIGYFPLAIAIFAFVALFIFQIPFPLVVLTAALLGAAILPAKSVKIEHARLPHWRQSVPIILIGCSIWFAPILISMAFGATFLTEIGVFFSKLAVVTFGGAYAVLAYMAQTVVSDFGWLSANEMLDALGLAETTPGPLILVTQFVAMTAGLAEGSVTVALLAGGMTLWVTFVPCFIWIFAGAPIIDWLAGQSRLQAALTGITAAVVGVIANLSVWFALHVFFGKVTHSNTLFSFLMPDFTTAKPITFLLALLAAFLLFGLKQSLFRVLFICAVTALAIGQAITF